MRDPHDIRHGDTWEVRNGRAVVVASNDWPPPAKGTHEVVWDRAQTVPRGGLLGIWRREVNQIWVAPKPMPWPWPPPSRAVTTCYMVPCIVMDDPPRPRPSEGTTTPHDQETGTQP